MQYKIILEDGAYALILRGKTMQQYAVVNGLDKVTGEWAYTCKYYGFGPGYELSEPLALSRALDCFLQKTVGNYISRLRLEDLVTKLKDGLLEDDEETAVIYLKETCKMSPSELLWCGITDSDSEESLLEQISTYFAEHIEQFYRERFICNGVDVSGHFVRCYIENSLLVIEHEENGVIHQFHVKNYTLNSLEQIFNDWYYKNFVVDLLSASRKE